eukprot:14757806-Ditylum_brightwellii.AAC.1
MKKDIAKKQAVKNDASPSSSRRYFSGFAFARVTVLLMISCALVCSTDATEHVTGSDTSFTTEVTDTVPQLHSQ